MTQTAQRPVSVELLRHLRRAHDHMDRQYQSDLDLDQVARVAGVSKFHFVRSFEATYGETPMRYLTRRRIERAQDLLRSANLTVTEICMLVGFASLGSFSRASPSSSARAPPRTATAGPPAAAPRPRLLPVHARRARPRRDHWPARPRSKDAI